MPIKPSLPSSATASAGNCDSRSRSAANGASRVRAKSRATSRSIRCSSVNLMGSASLDDLVGERKDRARDREAERLRGLEVDRQFESRRLLDRQIGGFRALEDLIDKYGRPPLNRGKARPIRKEHPRLDKGAQLCRAGQAMAQGEPGDVVADRDC